MSLHIGAEKGAIAESVFICGDPLRAKFLASHFLSDVTCYNEVRGAWGFTGSWKGRRVSIQGTGMGVPSTAIYVQELLEEYGVRQIVRLGSCGAVHDHVALRDLVFAVGASTDSAVHRQEFPAADYAPVADFGLLEQSVNAARKKGCPFHTGNVLTTDWFYHPEPEIWKKWAKWGVLALEMETSVLYSLAARYQARALTILTVSDRLTDNTRLGTEEREKSLVDMAEIGLELAV